MRTDEDCLRLEAENRLSRERLSAGPEIVAELKLSLAEFLAPRARERPELQVTLRVLASLAGAPSLCERRECRRKGACLAEDNPPPCREYWSKRLCERFDDIALGIELSSLRHQQEDANFYAWACEQMDLAPDGKASPRKPTEGRRRLNAPTKSGTWPA
jgi:hypothetical protein